MAQADAEKHISQPFQGALRNALSVVSATGSKPGMIRKFCMQAAFRSSLAVNICIFGRLRR